MHELSSTGEKNGDSSFLTFAVPGSHDSGVTTQSAIIELLIPPAPATTAYMDTLTVIISHMGGVKITNNIIIHFNNIT